MEKELIAGTNRIRNSDTAASACKIRSRMIHLRLRARNVCMIKLHYV
jgi:hypothetical protein